MYKDILQKNIVEPPHNTIETSVYNEPPFSEFEEDANSKNILKQAGLSLNRNDLDSAVKLYNEYLIIEPKNSSAYNGLGLVYQKKKDYATAIKYYQKAILLNYNFINAINNLSICFYTAGDIQSAIKYFEKALKINPKSALTNYNYGNLFHKIGELDKAKGLYNEAIKQKENYFEAYLNLGIIYLDEKNFPLSEQYLLKSLKYNPASFEALFNLGYIKQVTNRFDAALEYYYRALKLNPNFAQLYFNIGNIYKEKHNFKKAKENYEYACKYKSDYYEAYTNLGIVFLRLENISEAIKALQTALKYNPNFEYALINYGVALLELGEISEAISQYDKVIKLDQNNKEAHFNKAVALLLTGNFEDGWKEYLWRLKSDEKNILLNHDMIKSPTNFKDKNILLKDEQGIGDVIQFIRYAKLIKENGGNVFFKGRNTLVQIFLQSQLAESINNTDKSKNIDFEIPLLSLPFIFKTNKNNIPNSIPYLKTDPTLTAYWNKKLVNIHKLKVGIAWQGNPKHQYDYKRSIDFTLFLPLFKISGIQFFSLQNNVDDKINSLLDKYNIIKTNANLVELVSIIQNLDLVITVDTATAHIAGALGKEVWTLLPKIPDWRWGITGDDTVWYPTMKLFRQQKNRNWENVILNVKNNLIQKIKINNNTVGLKKKAHEAIDNNDLETALELFGKFIRHYPRDFESNFWLANINFLKGYYEDSIKYFQNVIDIYPKVSPDIYLNMGYAYEKISDNDSSLKIYKSGIEIFPTSSSLHNNTGLLFEKLKKFNEAEKYLRTAIKTNPKFIEARKNLARLFITMKKLDDAIKQAEFILNTNIDDIDALNIIGNAYLLKNNFEQAEKYFRKILDIDITEKHALNNLGFIFQKQKNYTEAERLFKQAISIYGYYPGAYSNLGNNYILQNDIKKGIENFNIAIKQLPTHKDAKISRGLAQLLIGNFVEGWKDFELSLGNYPEISKNNTVKKWNGEKEQGKSILIYSEHGFGDIIQFSRYLKLIKNYGLEILFIVPEELYGLYNNSQLIDKLLIPGKFNYNELNYDYYTSILSLARIFNTDLSNIPNVNSTINIDKNLVEVWNEKLNAETKLKVGFVWAGNRNHGNDHNRSMEIENLEQLFHIKNIKSYVLQKSLNEKEKTFIVNHKNITDLSGQLKNFAVTGAIINNLDLIITVDTSIVHLSGSLGKKTWLLLPFSPDWRWMLKRNDSLWYSSVEIFRQTIPGNWENVILTIKNKLEKLLCQ